MHIYIYIHIHLPEGRQVAVEAPVEDARHVGLQPERPELYYHIIVYYVISYQI